MKVLQGLKETPLTKNIIIPLLERMNYLKVEYYGGIDERGKDIIIWEKDNFGDIRLSVAQVKHFKLSKISSDTRSLTTVVNQLTQCFTDNPIQYSDKTTHLPFEVMLFSTHPIDSKIIKSRFSLNPNLIDKKIRIIDGLKLSTLLITHYPEKVKELLNEDTNYYNFLSKKLTNKAVLKALGFFEDVEIADIYTDIDFSIGKRSTELFYKSDYIGKDLKETLNEKEWEVFKHIMNKTKDIVPIDYMSNTSAVLNNFKFNFSYT